MYSNQIKRIMALVMFVCMSFVFFGCENRTPDYSDDRLKIVTTIFPPFDFAREIACGRADVSMLLKPGMESHSYEPSPTDIISIESCDLFIYTGGESDTWIDEILKTIDNPDLRIIKMMDCVDTLQEEMVEGMQGAHVHSDYDHEHDESGDHGDDHDHEAETDEYDEHIWTAPLNAAAITEAIADCMSELDRENSDFYTENAKSYIEKLKNLDLEFKEIVSNAKRKIIIFGDRFPFRYLAEAYGLEYRAAFPGCSAESEPSAKTVAYLMDKVREDNIPNIFYIEFSNQKIAKSIQEETGAVPLILHSCHNLSKDEMDKGMTYLELMQQNAANIKEALN